MRRAAAVNTGLCVAGELRGWHGQLSNRSPFRSMQEIIALHQKILSLPEEARPTEGVNFSRAEEDSEHVGELPAELQAELASLRQAINEALPEDFDYFVFVGQPDEEPLFDLLFDQMPAASSEDDFFQADRPLVEQLRELNWDEQRESAVDFKETLDGMSYLTARATEPLRSTKSLQREFREEAKEFIKAKRSDGDHIHILYWDDEAEKMMEAKFADGEALRDSLPSLVARGLDVVTLVVWGKPLPVERIDALMTQAQNALRERMAAEFEKAQAEEENDLEDQSEGTGPAES